MSIKTSERPRYQSVLCYRDGDLAIIRLQPRVENGQIAAGRVSDLLIEAALKIVRWTRTTLTLEPANCAYSALVFKGWQRKRVSIIGKLVGIVRRVGR
jgi:repressor LexA